MFNRLFVFRFFVSLLAFCLFSSNIYAARSDNPFAKNESLDIGMDSAWTIDKTAKLATKSKSDGKGSYYHLLFNNKQIELKITKDAAGAVPKEFSQLEIKNVEIDGKQSSLFKWCLKNQERHDRFLQQGLSVKKNICSIDGLSGVFVMRLNKATLDELKGGSSLSIMLKPFRTPLVLNYDLGDFRDMYIAMNKKAVPVAAAAPVAAQEVAPVKKCYAEAPAKYKSIMSEGYVCDDTAAKISAETKIAKQVEQEKAKERQLAAEKEKQRKLAEEKKKAELAELARQEELRAAEAAAIAASEAKQAQLGGEITEKMVGMCRKFWDKGEHRCYCQKYIEHAPADIQASSTCD
jgi:flagellar biosynthesis GTPase FlhF